MLFDNFFAVRVIRLSKSEGVGNGSEGAGNGFEGAGNGSEGAGNSWRCRSLTLNKSASKLFSALTRHSPWTSEGVIGGQTTLIESFLFYINNEDYTRTSVFERDRSSVVDKLCSEGSGSVLSHLGQVIPAQLLWDSKIGSECHHSGNEYAQEF